MRGGFRAGGFRGGGFRGRGGARGAGRGGGQGVGRGTGRGGPGGGVRGRGRPRGRPRGTGDRSGRKSYNTAPEGAPDSDPDPNSSGDEGGEEEEPELASEEDDEDDDTDGGEGQEKSIPYAALLESLKAKAKIGTSSKKHDDGDVDGRKAKRRKLENMVVAEDENQELSDVNDAGEEVDEDDEALQEGEGEEDEEVEEDTTDPFETHFAIPPKGYAEAVGATKRNEWTTIKVVQPEGDVGRMTISVPATGDPAATAHVEYVGKKVIKSISELKLKPRLRTPICALTQPIQMALAPAIFSYTDVYLTTRNITNAPHLRHLYALHAINHIFKTRDRVLKNNAKLSKLSSSSSDAAPTSGNPPDLRDQGFTRPKVLILLPTRNSALNVINTLTQLSQPDQQDHRKRLQEQFGLPPDTVDPITISTSKPPDFRDLFAGNHDDLFRIGIKFTRKTIKYFSSFYNSDIILASPLGLRMAIGASEEEAAFADDRQKRKKYKQKQDYGFLSSIEICIIDQADAILMQNWEHVLFCLSHTNLMPKDLHASTDYSRVREWTLDSLSPYFRQTILLSSYSTPELQSFYHTHMRNSLGGRLTTRPITFPGTPLTNTTTLIHPSPIQIFHRITPTPASPSKDPDSRFTFFTKQILPHHLLSPRGPKRGILIYIPSYFDFIRLRNFFDSGISLPAPVSFGCISEETPMNEVARARAHFMNGRYRVLLYSGRAHHFRRYVIKGCREVVFYGVLQGTKDAGGGYEEIAGFLGVEGGKEAAGEEQREWKGKVRTVFSKWDGLALERVVGTERVRVMLDEGRGDVFEFV